MMPLLRSRIKFVWVLPHFLFGLFKLLRENHLINNGALYLLSIVDRLFAHLKRLREALLNIEYLSFVLVFDLRNFYKCLWIMDVEFWGCFRVKEDIELIFMVVALKNL